MRKLVIALLAVGLTYVSAQRLSPPTTGDINLNYLDPCNVPADCPVRAGKDAKCLQDRCYYNPTLVIKNPKAVEMSRRKAEKAALKKAQAEATQMKAEAEATLKKIEEEAAKRKAEIVLEKPE